MKWLWKKRLEEKHPLPVGVPEFHQWATRIINAAQLPSRLDDQKYVLANVICNNCSPSTAFESDAFFISYLRKVAANQVADAMRKEIYEKRKAEQKQSAAGAPNGGAGGEVLPITGI